MAAPTINMPTQPQPSAELRRALGTCRGAFIAIAFFSVFSNVLMFASPLYMLQVYDRVLTSRNETTLVMLTLVIGGMLLIYGLIEMTRSMVLVRIGHKVDQVLNERVFTAVFRSSLRSTSTAEGQATRDLDSVRDFLAGGALVAFFDAPWVPLFIAVGFMFHPWLGIVSLLGAVLIFGLAVLNDLSTRRHMREASNENVKAARFFESSLRNTETVHAMGMLPAIYRRWLERRRHAMGMQARATDRVGTILAMSKFVRIGIQTAILGVGALLAIRQEITPGTMIAASIIMGRALAPIEQAVGQWRNVGAVRAAYARLGRLLAVMPPDSDRMSLPPPKGALSVERAVGSPPGSNVLTLKGVTFALQPGECLGVIGPSAAGKSTLARVLVGVWPLAGGSVRLDGTEISHWRMDELGPAMGYLPQDVELFDGTVAENIARMGEPDPMMVVNAAMKAGAHELVQRLPQGYSTPVGEGGRGLSGGQRQRIALARALYGDPRLIILDEPNANLDSDGDAALFQSINTLKAEGRTVVVITHRRNLLALVDKVLMLNGGQQERFGTRDEVLEALSRLKVVPAGAQQAAAGGGRPAPVAPQPAAPQRS